MVEAGRMELNKFHVFDFRPGAPRERYAVARRGIGVAGIKINLTAAARGENRIGRAYGINLARRFIENVCAHATVVSLETETLRHHEIDDNGILTNVDIGLFHGADHRVLALLARYVARMENAPGAVPSLARQIPRSVGLFGELDAAIYKIANRFRSVLANRMNDLGVAEPCSGYHRVARMLIESVVLVHHAADAALGEIRVAVFKTAFRDNNNLAVARQVQSTHKPGHAGADNKIITIYRLHSFIYFIKKTALKQTRTRQQPLSRRSSRP